MNFAMMAQSMGVPGERVQSPEEFDEALDKAFATNGPFLVEVDMEHFSPMEISIMPKHKPVDA